MSQPEFYFEEFSETPLTVHVSDSALIHLVLSAVESYHVRPWGKEFSSNRGPVETGGLLLGYFNQGKTMDHVVVEHISTDTYAHRAAGSNTLNDEVIRVKRDILAVRWPHLSLVGDFHTHPYATDYTIEQMNKDQAWKFSEGDYDSYERGSDPWTTTQWPGRVGLVLTMTLPQRKTPIRPELIRNNVLQWQQADYRFWLAAYSIDVLRDEDQFTFVVSPGLNERSTKAHRPHVYLDVPTINGTHDWFDYSE